MQKRWTGKNVDLDLLSEHVEEFFKDRGLITKKTVSQGKRTVLWVPQNTRWPVNKAMKANIVGDSNDFTIELAANEQTLRSIKLGLLMKPLGGGYIALRGLRIRETLEKIEREFWVYVEDEVAHFAGSAKNP